MAKAPTDIRSLARSHTETAIKVLAGIMREPDAPAAARVSAAQVLLDRGWGKAPQFNTTDLDDFRKALDLSDDELVCRIEFLRAGGTAVADGVAAPPHDPSQLH